MVHMADEGSTDTFEYTVSGRLLTFKTMTKGRIDTLRRYVDTQQALAKAAVERDDLDAVINIGKKINKATWTAVESQFTSAEDLEWVQMEIIAGRVEEQELLVLLSNGRKLETLEDDADPVPAKRPGRKAPAKKAAKVAKAAPSRAKR